jgi:HK97 family phage prohead protease
MKPKPVLCYRAVEFRAQGSDGRTLEGYASVFDQPTRIHSWEGEFDEVIRKGSFAKTIKERTPVLQFDHGRDARTGSVPIGSVEVLEEDKNGLFVRASLFENDVVEPIRQAIEGGAIDGMSFRFRVLQEDWTDKDGNPVPASELSRLLYSPGDRGPLLRSVTEVQLYELGPVVFPAYEGTSVGVRSILAALDSQEREQLVRELAAEMRVAVDLTPSGAGDATPDEPTTTEADASHFGLQPDERESALRLLQLGGN